MGKKKEDTYQSVSNDLEALLSLAPKAVQDTWNADIEEKNKEDAEMKMIGKLEKEYTYTPTLLENIKSKGFQSVAAKEKEKEYEIKLIEEYKHLQKRADSIAKAYGAWIYSIVIAVIATLGGITIGPWFSWIGIIIAILVVLAFWGVVIEKKEDVDSIKDDQSRMKQIENKFIINNDTVQLKNVSSATKNVDK